MSATAEASTLDHQPQHGRQELRTPEGWLIRRADTHISVMAPDANPGMTPVAHGKGRLEARLLYALANALLLESPPAPPRSDAEAFADRLEEISLNRDRITPSALREAAAMIRVLARRTQPYADAANIAEIAALEASVIDNAVAWWEMHRPIGWTADEHHANPSVNVTGGPERDKLAQSTSSLLQQRRGAIAESTSDV